MKNPIMNSNTLTNLWQGTKDNLIIYLVDETESDYETLEMHDRFILLNYATYLDRERKLDQPVMPFQEWIANPLNF